MTGLYNGANLHQISGPDAMPQIAAFEEVKAQRRERQVPTGTAWRTSFIEPDAQDPATPQAFLVEGTPGRVIRPHFHEHDQYQVIVSGDGLMGRHAVSANAVHFSRAHTPYGPIVFGEGMGFLTLRAVRDAGAQYLDEPEKLARLKALEKRRPWQATEAPQFDPATAGSALHAFAEIHADDGLAGFSISVAPNAKAQAPDPADSDGQYLIVVRGSLLHAGREYGALSVAFVSPQEGCMELVAGAGGLDVLVLHFPRSAAAPRVEAPRQAPSAPGTRVWQCQLCAFVYDEALGLPDEGIAPGTPWEAVPETWYCPDCSAAKSDFQMALVG
jgi:rubredoxin